MMRSRIPAFKGQHQPNKEWITHDITLPQAVWLNNQAKNHY
jgi:hypothetical protein